MCIKIIVSNFISFGRFHPNEYDFRAFSVEEISGATLLECLQCRLVFNAVKRFILVTYSNMTVCRGGGGLVLALLYYKIINNMQVHLLLPYMYCMTALLGKE